MPSKYKKEYIKKVYKYLASKEDKMIKFARRGIRKRTGQPWVIYDDKLKVKLPTIEGFAKFLRVTRMSLYNWEKEYPKFAVALDKIRSEQKDRLINMGLSGDYNPTIVKLMLSSNHGMRERIDATTGDKPINKFNDDQIDKIADRIARRKRNDGDTSGKKKSD